MPTDDAPAAPLRVLITGITGMIGSNIAAALIARTPLNGVPLPPSEIFGLCRFRSDMRMLQTLVPQFDSALTLLRGDLDDPYSVHAAVRKSNPDIVFHMAAQAYNGVSWGAPALTLHTNVVGTAHLLEALRACNRSTARVVMAASSAQYGAGINLVADPSAPLDERTPQLPLSPYGVSKASMELLGRQYFANYGMPIMFARLFPQVGVGQSEELAIQSFARQVALVESGAQRPAQVRVGNLRTLRDYSDVEETAVGLAHLALKGVGGEAYNFASGRAHRMRDLLDAMIAMSSTPWMRVKVDAAKLRASDEPLLLGNASKVWQLLGWQPTHDLTRSIRRVLQYWRARVRPMRDGLSSASRAAPRLGGLRRNRTLNGNGRRRANAGEGGAAEKARALGVRSK